MRLFFFWLMSGPSLFPKSNLSKETKMCFTSTTKPMQTLIDAPRFNFNRKELFIKFYCHLHPNSNWQTGEGNNKKTSLRTLSSFEQQEKSTTAGWTMEPKKMGLQQKTHLKTFLAWKKTETKPFEFGWGDFSFRLEPKPHQFAVPRSLTWVTQKPGKNATCNSEEHFCLSSNLI